MNEERLYNLLPALYRQRDEGEGEPLRALMSVLESQFKTLEADIFAGYDNWFVATCDPWVLPYLAELIGISNLRREKKHIFPTQRRQVANAIGYRCRKGTIATLEHVVRDATGWLACAVEFDQRLAVTHHLARMPREQERTVDVRHENLLAALGGPFDELAHTAEVCGQPLARIPREQERTDDVCGEPPASADAATLPPRRYGVGRLGLFCWRLRSFRMTNCRPHSNLLDFLNWPTSAHEIVRRIFDDPRFGSASSQAYGVRLSLAKDIIDERDKLPGRRFESLQQVDAVGGVGPDTLHDMLACFPGPYTFHPLGVDMPLFNFPQYIAEIDQRAGEADMPLALSQSQFEADLEDYEKTYGHNSEGPASSRFYGPDRGLNVAIWQPNSLEPTSIPPSGVLSMDLSQWNATLVNQMLKKEENKGKKVAIDVELGRLALLTPYHPGTKDLILDKQIRVTYCYGFSMPMGGGPYHRDLQRLFSVKVPLDVDFFHIDVAKGAAGNKDGTGAAGKETAAEAEGQTIPPDCVPTLSQALKAWDTYQDALLENQDDSRKNQDRRPHGVIRILDNGRYDEELKITLKTGAHLTIVADNGARPVIGNNEPLTVVCEGNGSEVRRQLDLSGLLIHGGLNIEPPEQDKTGAKGSEERRQPDLSGLLIHGGLSIKPPQQDKTGAKGWLAVKIEHCTLVMREEYQFTWEDVPGKDEGRLLRYLREGLALDWATGNQIVISKPKDGKTIRVEKDRDWAEIVLNTEVKTATLTTSDGKHLAFPILTTSDGKHLAFPMRENRLLKPAPIRVELAEEQARGLDLSIESSIVGPLILPETMANLKVSNSVVDSGSECAIAADDKGEKSGPTVNLERATIFGQVHALKVVASEVIFTGALKTGALKTSGPETQDEIQHSYVPPASTTGKNQPHPSISRVVAPPRFTSTRYGDPGYAQLSLDCPREIRGGGTDGAEMGAFHDLYQLQAEENLREVLEEYLPLGLQASIHYVT